MPLTANVAALCALSAAELRQAAFLCGSTLTGRKSVVAEKLYKLCAGRAIYQDNCRVLSIDLGLKNIGICRLLTRHVESIQTRPLVESWHLTSLPTDVDFAYPEFSTTAINTVKDLLSCDEPVDAVVIEKQRARSSGSPMIPNGILRVNVMEGMVFTALQTLHPNLYLESVSPKHVVDFSKDFHAEKDAPKRPNRTPAQSYRDSKLVRRNLLKQWIADPRLAPIDFNPDINLTRQGKRDDMDDALVQALTWAQWRANSRQLLANLDSGSHPLTGILNQVKVRL